MKWLVLALWALVSPAQAQFLPLGVAAPSGGGGGYVGPGDVSGWSSPLLWTSCAYAFNNAWAAAHGNLCDYKNANSALTCTAVSGTNGKIDLTTAYCTGVSGAVNIVTFCSESGESLGCEITKRYDQSGNARDSGVSTAHAVFSYQTSLPCINYAMNPPSITTIPNTAQPVTISAVFNPNSIGANDSDLLSTLTSTTGVVFSRKTAGSYHIWSTNLSSFPEIVAAVTEDTLHAGVFVYNSASSVFGIDGTETTGDAGAFATDTQFGIGGSPRFGGSSTSELHECESGLWAFAPSSGQRSALNANEHSRWGF